MTARACASQTIFLTAILLIGGCAHGERTAAPAPAPSVGALEPGTIRKVGDFGFAIVPDRDPGTRYAAETLPPELQQDGLRVMFAGLETSPPPDVRMWATPFQITTIRKAE